MNAANKKQWLAIYTRPRHEKKAAERLQKQGIEVYCPLMTTMRQWSDRKKKVSVPMFTSYVFVRVSESERWQVLQVTGVKNFVFWLGQPAVIREEEIRAIRYIAEEVEGAEVTGPAFKRGDYVTIDHGPFKDVQGIVETDEGNHIYLFIEALQCQIKVAKVKVGA